MNPIVESVTFADGEPLLWVDEFPVLGERIFLNHAADSPLPARSAAALHAFADEACLMGAAAWPRWAGRMSAARREAARLLGAADDDVAFIHNTTHGLLCIANSLPWRPGDNIVTAANEFPANVHPWRNLAERGVALRVVPERPDHRFCVDDFTARLDARTRLVAVSLVQYSTGYRMPAEMLAALCRERGVWFCLDAIQGLGALPAAVGDLGCDFLAADGRKWLLGADGAGVLYVRPDCVPIMNRSMVGWIGRPRRDDYDDLAQPPLPNARRFEEGAPNVGGLPGRRWRR
ncbi:MAG: aminotransferase class V-fold PLP-dependent enzyme, partial [bacterium]|nr:aminotransferase class V-fold PLP-dependent enzyme [bacterium]